MEKKLSKLKREMELFGQQAVVSKYRRSKGRRLFVVIRSSLCAGKPSMHFEFSIMLA